MSIGWFAVELNGTCLPPAYVILFHASERRTSELYQLRASWEFVNQVLPPPLGPITNSVCRSTSELGKQISSKKERIICCCRGEGLPRQCPPIWWPQSLRVCQAQMVSWCVLSCDRPLDPGWTRMEPARHRFRPGDNAELLLPVTHDVIRLSIRFDNLAGRQASPDAARGG